jgi:hypothetical protein
LNIKSNLTTAYHPQSDGATERVNQEIEAYLSIYCTSHPEDWLHSLSTLEFTHNNRGHAERIHSPFELIQGDNPISVPITFSHTKFPMMSTPDALPMEIALIALPLFKFQVHSTSLCHYYHRPITLSTFRLP